MTFFTDSPFERMMVQRPRSNPGPSPVTRPPGCKDCPYAKGKPCVGVCTRELLAKKEGKET